MGIFVSMSLFGKPGWELDEGEEVKAEELRGLGDSLKARLDEAARAVEVLKADGWDNKLMLYDIAFMPPDTLKTVADVRRRLKTLNLDVESFTIDIEDDEGDDLRLTE